MSESDRILDQLQKAYAGGAWHGPALREVLQGVQAQEASAHPIPNAHSIWEIVAHLTASCHVIERRLQGDRADLSEAEDWPALDPVSEQSWQDGLVALEAGHQAVIQQGCNLSDERLDQPIVPGYSSIYRTLHGHIQHLLYHAGQIALLIKAQR